MCSIPLGARMNARALKMMFAGLALFFSASVAYSQSCRWDGTAPFCNGSCGGNEMEVTRLDAIPDFWVPPFVNGPSFGKGCATGSKALCCKSPGLSCRWDGTAPFCDGSCSNDEVVSQPPGGSSSGAKCVTGHKVYCCKRGPSVGVTGQALTARDCKYGPGTCLKGFVWREARPGDHVCVTPRARDQARKDNAAAASRRSPTGGAYGADTCRQGFVWRDAFAGDHVCVPVATRTQAAHDNKWANVRNVCP